MKRIEDIEKLSFEQLEAISNDSSIEVPAGLRSKVEASLLAASATTERKRKTSVLRSLYAAAAVALASLVVVLSIPQQPKDTFDDPLLAYAELERCFEKISSKAAVGFELASQAEAPLDKTKEVFNR